MMAAREDGPGRYFTAPEKVSSHWRTSIARALSTITQVRTTPSNWLINLASVLFLFTLLSCKEIFRVSLSSVGPCCVKNIYVKEILPREVVNSVLLYNNVVTYSSNTCRLLILLILLLLILSPTSCPLSILIFKIPLLSFNRPTLTP